MGVELPQREVDRSPFCNGFGVTSILSAELVMAQALFTSI